MRNSKEYIEIKEEQIPVIIKSYKKSMSVRIYFKEGIMNVTKPVYCPKKEVIKIIRENEDKICNEYIKIKENSDRYFKTFKTGDIFLYAGEEYIIERKENLDNNFSLEIRIDEDKKRLYIYIPGLKVEEEILNENIKRLIKKMLRENLKAVISKRLEVLSKLTNISYNSFKITDAKTRFGSCIPKSRNLNFTLRLMMLDIEKIDAVIIHELCHIVYPNHSKDFYNLVKKYSPNYDKIDKWLKNNSYKLII